MAERQRYLDPKGGSRDIVFGIIYIIFVFWAYFLLCFYIKPSWFWIKHQEFLLVFNLGLGGLVCLEGLAIRNKKEWGRTLGKIWLILFYLQYVLMVLPLPFINNGFDLKNDLVIGFVWICMTAILPSPIIFGFFAMMNRPWFEEDVLHKEDQKFLERIRNQGKVEESEDKHS